MVYELKGEYYIGVIKSLLTGTILSHENYLEGIVHVGGNPTDYFLVGTSLYDEYPRFVLFFNNPPVNCYEFIGEFVEKVFIGNFYVYAYNQILDGDECKFTFLHSQDVGDIKKSGKDKAGIWYDIQGDNVPL